MYTLKFDCKSYLKLLKCVKNVVEKDAIHSMKVSQTCRMCSNIFCSLAPSSCTHQVCPRFQNFLFNVPCNFALIIMLYVPLILLLIYIMYSLQVQAFCCSILPASVVGRKWFRLETRSGCSNFEISRIDASFSYPNTKCSD